MLLLSTAEACDRRPWILNKVANFEQFKIFMFTFKSFLFMFSVWVFCDQVAQQKMCQLLTSQESLSRLGGAPQASLQTLAAMLALNAGQQPSALQEAAPQDTWQSGTRDALRYQSRSSVCCQSTHQLHNKDVWYLVHYGFQIVVLANMVIALSSLFWY